MRELYILEIQHAYRMEVSHRIPLSDIPDRSSVFTDKKCQGNCSCRNTASAFALETIKPELDIPIIGVVKPGAKVAAQTTQNGKIGVIGTEGTIRSEIYTKTIHRENKDAQVMGGACPLFVPLVEEGWIKDPVTVAVAERYLQPFKESDIDTLILGCTHYPLLRSTVREIMGEGVNLVNPAYETAVELRRLYPSEELQMMEKQRMGRKNTSSMSAMRQRSLCSLPILFCHMTLSRHSSFR